MAQLRQQLLATTPSTACLTIQEAILSVSN
jgi:hypothetical protein